MPRTRSLEGGLLGAILAIGVGAVTNTPTPWLASLGWGVVSAYVYAAVFRLLTRSGVVVGMSIGFVHWTMGSRTAVSLAQHLVYGAALGLVYRLPYAGGSMLYEPAAYDLQIILSMGEKQNMPVAVLSQLRVAVLVTDGFEESELTEPLRTLTEAGAQVEIVSLERKSIQGVRHLEKGRMVRVDFALAEVKPELYDALLLPGGEFNADRLRADPCAIEFVSAFARDGKPIAAICHAPWVLLAAGAVNGRTLTANRAIAKDLMNAGADFVDREVVVDGNLVTSRDPNDLPAFNREMLALFAKIPHTAAA